MTIAYNSSLVIEALETVGIPELVKRKEIILREGLINKSIGGSSRIN